MLRGGGDGRMPGSVLCAVDKSTTPRSRPARAAGVRKGEHTVTQSPWGPGRRSRARAASGGQMLSGRGASRCVSQWELASPPMAGV